MKINKFFILCVLMTLVSLSANAQFGNAYQTLNVRSADRYSSTNRSAISIESVTLVADGNGYEIKFCDTQNVNRAVEQYATSFEYYLTYNGKRVSDYQTANSNYKYYFTSKCYTWPNAVPKGYENYVTVQLGREPAKKDSRDDD